MGAFRIVSTCLFLLLPCGAFAHAADDRPPAPALPAAHLIDSVPATTHAVAAEHRSRSSGAAWSAKKKGAVAGLVAGAIGGVVFGSIVCEGWRCERAALFYGAVFGGAGAAIGAEVGTQIDGEYVTHAGRRTINAAPGTRVRRVSYTWRF